MSEDKDLKNYEKLYYGSLLTKDTEFNPAHLISELGTKKLSQVEIDVAENLTLREKIIRERELIENNEIEENDYYLAPPKQPILVEQNKSFQNNLIQYKDYYPGNNHSSTNTSNNEFKEMMERNRKELDKILEERNKDLVEKKGDVEMLNEELVPQELPRHEKLENIPNISECPLFNLRKKTMMLERKMGNALRVLNLSYGRFMTLWGCCLLDNIEVSPLTKFLFVDKRTVTLNLEFLEDYGYLISGFKHKPYRKYFVLTQNGKEAFLKALEVWRNVKDE